MPVALETAYVSTVILDELHICDNGAGVNKHDFPLSFLLGCHMHTIEKTKQLQLGTVAKVC
eukprot:4587230-Amphidinium_carterae.1